jgi:aryl-alcohol dehydrogenase-like predicted oxidoreductase
MRYIILGQHTGLRVPELVLGTRMFGTKWGHGADLDESRRMFDGYVESGGNFLDTSDSYQIGDLNPCSASSSRQTGTIS